MRSNDYQRDDFLMKLARENLPIIARITRSIAGDRATEDLIRGESTQAFLLAANRAINSARLTDDGRGENDPVKWCKWKGFNGVHDYLRLEFGTTSRMRSRHIMERSIFLESDFKKEKINNRNCPGQEDFVIQWIFRDPVDYEEKIISHFSVQEHLEKFENDDRAILELLVYGHTDSKNIKCAGKYGSRFRNNALDIAMTIHRSESYVLKRLSQIRATMRSN